jgi:hypothetical protein
MHNRTDLITLANTILTIRPNWSQGAVIHHTGLIPGTWPQVVALAIANANDPTIQTPALLGQTRTAAPKPSTDPDHGPKCFTCGRTRHMCDHVHAKETRLGLPDPHQFETKDEAEANAVHMPGYVRAALDQLVATQNLNKRIGWTPADSNAIRNPPTHTPARRVPELPYVPPDLAAEAAAPLPPDTEDQEQPAPADTDQTEWIQPPAQQQPAPWSQG